MGRQLRSSFGAIAGAIAGAMAVAIVGRGCVTAPPPVAELHAGASDRTPHLAERRRRDSRQATVAPASIATPASAEGNGAPATITPDGNGAPATVIPDRNRAPATVAPDGNDDGIVARRLRQAAELETDPKLKQKLWNEYVEFKKNTQGQTLKMN